MGQASSNSNPEALQNNNSLEANDISVGYRVLGVQLNSPGIGMVTFFDFIIKANGILLPSLYTM